MSGLRRIRSRLSDEAGFTLVELLAAMIIGLLVIFAAFGLTTRAFQATNEATDRVDAAQRGRVAMDVVTRQMGSMVCFSGTLPLISGSPTAATFVTDLGDGTTSPERHTLTFTANTSGSYNLVETDYTMTSVNGATPVTWSSSPARTKTLLANVAQDGSTPFLSYLGYSATTADRTTALNSTLTSDDLDNVTQIAVTFNVKPEHASTAAARGTTLSERIAVPQADPNLTDPRKTSVAATC
jgi:Tfp pilus assembly protein PilW